MKILHITPAYKPAFVYGGPTLSVSQLCEHQAAIGNEVTVVTTTANGNAELEEGEAVVEGVKVYYFKRLTKDHTHLSPALLIFLWRNSRQFDTIHIHSWWNLVSVLATLVCYLKGITPVLSPRGMLSNFSFVNSNSIKKRLIHRGGGKFLLRKTRLHATSLLEWSDAHRINKQWPGFVLPNIIDLPNHEFARSASTDTLKLVFLSRIHAKKGLELTLEALSNVSFPFQLEIYGDGEEEYVKSLKALATTVGIDQAILWKGWVSGEAKYRALSGGDVFILTSYNENFANVVLESLAVGTPALISDQVGMCDYVKQTGAGWVCETSVESIVSTLNNAYRLRNKITVNINKVYDDFDGRNVSEQYSREYQRWGKASSADYRYSHV